MTANATTTALLKLAGFANIAEAFAAMPAGSRSAIDTPAGRIAHSLGQALLEVDTAADTLTVALDRLPVRASREQANLVNGYTVDPTWIAQSVREIEAAQAKLAALSEKVQMLIWLRDGNQGNREALTFDEAEALGFDGTGRS